MRRALTRLVTGGVELNRHLLWRSTPSQCYNVSPIIINRFFSLTGCSTSKTDNVEHVHVPDPELLSKADAEAGDLKAKDERTNELIAKAKDFEEKYLLALADMDNLRKRLTKQINDSKLYAIQGFCKDLTEIEDILQLAITSTPKDQINNSNKHLKELYEGLTMTEARLLQVFKSHGLTQINPIDSKFNPNEHEAVLQKEEPGKESGTVIFVSKLGYKLHDRVIRPAVVGVAK